MKLAIIGSREFDNYDLLCETIGTYFCSTINSFTQYTFDEIVSGGARGADALGAKFAREHGIKLTEYIPDWDKYGKRAGFFTQ